MNAAAGLLDGYGGINVIVGPLEDMDSHGRPGQILIVVDGFEIEEFPPEAAGKVAAWLVPAVIRAVEEWIRGLNDPEIRDHDAVKLYLIRKSRTYHRESVHLGDIVET